MTIDPDENEDPSRAPPTIQGSDRSDSKAVETTNATDSISSDVDSLVPRDSAVAVAREDTTDTTYACIIQDSATDDASDDTSIRASSDAAVAIPCDDSTVVRAASCVLSLKRKRPPKIEIPSYLNDLPFRDIEKGREIIQSLWLGGAVYSVRGRRRKKQLEDRYKVVRSFNGDLKNSFFGVYDGHGGQHAVKFVTKNLHEYVLDALNDNVSNLGKEEVMKAAYLKTDSEFLKLGMGSGTCCVTCLVEEKEITVSNLGDCRAILCRINGTAEALTKDHKAGDEEERRRVERMGGNVEKRRGAWRVNGDLAISRSIGDAHLKCLVIAEPDTKVLNITPDMEFLILASDGLWDKVSNEEAVDITKAAVPYPKLDMSSTDKSSDCKYSWNKIDPPSMPMITSTGWQQKTEAPGSNTTTGSPNSFRLMTACEKLVAAARRKGSLDDITVMVIDLLQL